MVALLLRDNSNRSALIHNFFDYVFVLTNMVCNNAFQ